MARPVRVAVPGAWYHVIARGIERRAIFQDEAYYRKFEELMGTLPKRFGVRVRNCGANRERRSVKRLCKGGSFNSHMR
jgi:hypothetical protein